MESLNPGDTGSVCRLSVQKYMKLQLFLQYQAEIRVQLSMSGIQVYIPNRTGLMLLQLSWKKSAVGKDVNFISSGIPQTSRILQIILGG